MNDHVMNAGGVSRRRLWFGALTPPGVWAAHSLAGFLVVVDVCRSRHQALARVLVLALTGVAFVAIGLTGAVALGSWRRLRDGERVAFAEARGQDEWLAGIGVYAAVVFALGVLWAGLQAVVMSGLCEVAR